MSISGRYEILHPSGQFGTLDPSVQIVIVDPSGWFVTLVADGNSGLKWPIFDFGPQRPVCEFGR